MAENETTKHVKYLSYEGLLLFKKQLLDYYAKNTKSGVVGASDVSYKLATPRKIDFIGGVQGEAHFDGSKDVTISTVLNIPSTIDSNITGNAFSATNFQNPKPINLTGDLEGYGVGGSDSNGWTVTASIKDGSVTSSKLFGEIANDKLLNSSITLGTTKASLGSTVTDIEGLNSITATTFVGNLEGVANSATTALADEKGNNIYTTYATKAEVQASQSTLKFKGNVATYSELPSNAENGDIYNVEDEGKTYIWSSADNKWSVFGSSYGPATSDNFGLVKVGENITNASGLLSINQSNVESALGYIPISGIKVNGTSVPSVDRIVDIQLSTEYYSKSEVDALIEGVKAWVREYVASTMQQATDEGKINDIRVYNSYALFPTTGVADVEYIDSSTGLEYHWVTDSEGGHYEQVNKTVTSEDISQMFTSM